MMNLIEIMARSVGARPQQNKNCDVEYLMGSEELERFASLVRADERNRTWTQEHWTEYERSIVEAEREACAKVCEDIDAWNMDDPASTAVAAIRARSNT